MIMSVFIKRIRKRENEKTIALLELTPKNDFCTLFPLDREKYRAIRTITPMNPKRIIFDAGVNIIRVTMSHELCHSDKL